jgi:hypothetical protein
VADMWEVAWWFNKLGGSQGTTKTAKHAVRHPLSSSPTSPWWISHTPQEAWPNLAVRAQFGSTKHRTTADCQQLGSHRKHYWVTSITTTNHGSSEYQGQQSADSILTLQFGDCGLSKARRIYNPVKSKTKT